MKRQWQRISVVLAGLVLLAGCNGGGAKPDGSGTIECTQVRVAPEVAGRIVTLAVDEGSAVTRGQTIAQLDTAMLVLKCDEGRAGLRLASQQLARVQSMLGADAVAQDRMDGATAEFDQMKTRLAQLEKSIHDATVLAPMDGVVTLKSAEAGEVVGVGVTLVTLSRTDEVWLSIYIPETRLASVKIGQKARVRADGRRETVEGMVTFISPLAEFTPRNVQTAEERAKLVFRVKITLPNPSGVFKPGMPADAWLE